MCTAPGILPSRATSELSRKSTNTLSGSVSTGKVSEPLYEIAREKRSGSARCPTTSIIGTNAGHEGRTLECDWGPASRGAILDT